MSEICFVCECPFVDGACGCVTKCECGAPMGTPCRNGCTYQERRMNREDDALRYWDWDDGAERYDDPDPVDESDVAHE